MLIWSQGTCPCFQVDANPFAVERTAIGGGVMLVFPLFLTHFVWCGKDTDSFLKLPSLPSSGDSSRLRNGETGELLEPRELVHLISDKKGAMIIAVLPRKHLTF